MYKIIFYFKFKLFNLICIVLFFNTCHLASLLYLNVEDSYYNKKPNSLTIMSFYFSYIIF